MKKLIGKSITHFREKLGLSKTDLAEKTGISPSSITQYENGNRNPSEENLVQIANALGISVNLLLEMAENIANQGPVIDEYRLRRKLDIIHSNNDLVFELSEYVLLAIRAQVHDLLFEMNENGRRVVVRRQQSPVQAIVERVMREFLNDNLEEIAHRVQEEMKRTETTVDEVLENIRNNLY